MMARQTKDRGQGWQVLLAVIGILGAGYVLAAEHLGSGPALASPAVAVFPAASSRDVSSAVVASIAGRLGGLTGRSPELVVTAAPGGAGYDVSATVDLGEDVSVARSAWADLVQKDVPLYFQGVFGSHESVQMAQIYFTLGGQIVAGAALGKDAYQNLTASASGGGNWLTALSTASPVTADGPSTRWFEMTHTGVG